MEYQITAEIYDRWASVGKADSSLYITEFYGKFTITQENMNMLRMWAN
jgi:hypothetical protein